MEAQGLYTVERARAMLPQVRSTLLQVALERQRADASAADRHAIVEALLDHLTSLGIIIRDLDSGLVDFPTMRDGEPAWLCWRLDDPDIAFWHSTREGYASRQPI